MGTWAILKKRLIIHRLLEKLIGASLSISIFFIFILISNRFNLFEFHKLVASPGVWILFFGYGLMSSIVIDFIKRFIPNFFLGKQILLYILFGYLIFLILMPTEYALIAGTVGAIFSLLFLLGKEKLKPSKWYSWIVFIIPLACVVMIPFNFTSKVGWDEVRKDASVEIEYDYFNGEHLVPIHGEQGERIYFEVEHHFNQGDSYGMSLYDENGNREGMNEENGGLVSVKFEEEATKYIAVQAINGSNGQFQVKWWLTKDAGADTLTTFTHNGQEIEINYFFEEVLEYTKVQNGDSDLNNQEIFTEYVLNPFEDRTSLSHDILDNIVSPTSRTEQLGENTVALLEKQEQINQWIEDALRDSIELLPGEDVAIYIFPVNPEDGFTIDKLEGVSGFAYFGNNIVLAIDPSVQEKTLKYTVAHEYNHTVNMSYGGEQSIHSVLDAMITEGKADSFASIVYPEVDVPWIKPLSDDEETAVLNELSEITDSTDRKLINDFSYGNHAKNVPRWSNYKIGYQITENFIKNNTDIPVKEWTVMTAKEIVEQSEYSNIVE